MISVVANLISWPFVVGLVVGFVLDRGYHVLRVCWLDRFRPLPDGNRRSRVDAARVDPRAGAAIVMIFLVGWSVFKTQENTDEAARITADARAFAAETRQCQKVLIQSITASRAITREYNAQSEDQLTALAGWLRTLLNPPPEMARLDGSDPVRQQWAIDVTAGYFRHIQQSQIEQAATDAKRPALPNPDCGR